MDALFTLGSNGSGQLGIGHKEDVSVPKPVSFHPAPPEKPVVKVAAGGNHTLLLTKSGKVYWSGDAESGACGIGPLTDVPVFQQMKLAKDGEQEPTNISLIAATWEASFLVAKDASGKNTELYSLGLGNKGELGLGDFIVRTPSATRVKDFPPPGREIVDIHACMGHVVVALDNGDAYGWGNCRKGQAGEPGAVIHTPRKINGLDFAVKRVVCTKEATCFFGDQSTGSIKVLGSDKWDLITKAPAVAPSWTDVGASWGNIYILTADKTLVSWGRDDHGQLPPPNVPAVAAMAIGSEHVVVRTEDGNVLAWGWGEHGNCGPKVENNDVKGRWNIIASSKYIPAESQIASIGAGCATSWVCITSR